MNKMAVHSLDIDDFIDSNYVLIGIHTGLEDYKLAYLLNQKFKILLYKSENLETKYNTICASFSVFQYEDEQRFCNWYLLQNIYQGKSKKPIQNGLFQTINETVNTTSYLIPEKKKMDYFLKIEGDLEFYQLNKMIKSINNIEQVVTSYLIDATTLKSKDFLIF